METIVYHIGPACVQCNQTKKMMTKLDIDFREVDLREEPELTEKFKAEGHMSAPIVTSSIGTWSGFRLDLIQDLAEANPKG